MFVNICHVNHQRIAPKNDFKNSFVSCGDRVPGLLRIAHHVLQDLRIGSYRRWPLGVEIQASDWKMRATQRLKPLRFRDLETDIMGMRWNQNPAGHFNTQHIPVSCRQIQSFSVVIQPVDLCHLLCYSLLPNATLTWARHKSLGL